MPRPTNHSSTLFLPSAWTPGGATAPCSSQAAPGSFSPDYAPLQLGAARHPASSHSQPRWVGVGTVDLQVTGAATTPLMLREFGPAVFDGLFCGIVASITLGRLICSRNCRVSSSTVVANTLFFYYILVHYILETHLLR